MATTSFTAPPIPHQAAPELRSFLDRTLQSMQPLLNGAAQRSQAETIDGDWTFSGGLVIPEAAVTAHQAALAIAASQVTSGTFANARIAQASITQHQAALSIAESQIADGTILARLTAPESISALWAFTAQAPALRFSFSDGATADVYASTFDGVTDVLRFRKSGIGDSSNMQFVFSEFDTADRSIWINPEQSRNAIRSGSQSARAAFWLDVSELRLQDDTGVMNLFSNGTIYLRRAPAAGGDSSGFGQLWVRSSDDALMFTSDSGVDRVVQTA